MIRLPITGANSENARSRGVRGMRGFSLIELILVIIIVGILAVIAVPRFIALGTDARIASVNTLASALNTTTQSVRVMCKLNAACDYGAQYQNITVAGQTALLCYGWLCAGSYLGGGHIDSWINYAGFTASGPTQTTTLFTLDGSVDPQNCSVSYDGTYYRGPTALPTIAILTSGC